MCKKETWITKCLQITVLESTWFNLWMTTKSRLRVLWNKWTKNVQSITNYSHVNINQISITLSCGGEESCIVPAEKKAKKEFGGPVCNGWNNNNNWRSTNPLKLVEGARCNTRRRFSHHHKYIKWISCSPYCNRKIKERRWKRVVIDSDWTG